MTYVLLQVALLVINAIIVLHGEPVFKNTGQGVDQGMGRYCKELEMKSQLIKLVRSIGTMVRVLFITVNSIEIVLLL
uniref:Immediate early response 3-interacting protein 1 n=1 Tax=Sus scrofa TaxID=9823 RepID=A0A8D1VPX1_PIG